MSEYDHEYVFELIRAAYERGYNWSLENPDSRPFLNKAAYDYADKTLGPKDLQTQDQSDKGGIEP